MTEIVFEAFEQQNQIINCTSKIIGAFAGKRSGKTEVGAIKSIIYQETKPDYFKTGLDEYTGAIIAPTVSMMQRLSFRKFRNYASPFIKEFYKSTSEIVWHDDSIIYGLSADNPQRLEGLKLNWAWLDEVLQMSESVFLEVLARVSDSNGFIICTGSLGPQFINPKQHWAYKYFKEKKEENFSCFEWNTEDNPYFPKNQLAFLKKTLDKKTYNAMFKIDWDTMALGAVYEDWSDENEIKNYKYNKDLPTFISIDWGWAHSLACIFMQYDRKTDEVYAFDEIVESKMTLENLYRKIMERNYKIDRWCCDISGNQEREQTGISNVRWFLNKGVTFSYRSSAINYGILLVRPYILNGEGKRRLKLDKDKCPKLLSGIKRYSNPQKDGIIINENPIKKDDDEVDALRYFFVNFLDHLKKFGAITSTKGL